MGWNTRFRRRVIDPIVNLPRLVRLVLVITTGLGVGAISAKGLARYLAPPPANPFLEFASVFPGQPESAVYAYPFSCSRDYTYGTLEKRCAYTLEHSPIASLYLTVTPGTITQTVFFLRDDTFQVGDLSGWLGVTTVQAYPDRVMFFLPDMVAIAKTEKHDTRPSLFLSVWRLSLTAMDGLEALKARAIQ
ncbi:MAG: hypothetical protein K8I30_18175 [Anaerolineae bacterium]|nr:hypothetical protein [Anaerolineae bacterium]